MASASSDSYEELKEQHKPDLTSLGDVIRNPTAAPLATAGVALICAALLYQAVTVALTYGVWVAPVVLAAGYLAYRVAKVFWKVENEHIASELAKRDLMDSVDPNTDE